MGDDLSPSLQALEAGAGRPTIWAVYGPPPRGPLRRMLRRLRRWLSAPLFHLLLFLLTVATTLAVGSHLAGNFAHHLAAFDLDLSPAFFLEPLRHPSSLAAGIPFAFTLLAILLAHELGHYFACRYYGVAATLPYFLPAPTLIGTLGAFIRIQSPIPTRRVLFDVGIAGPIAGFVVAVPTLWVGVLQSSYRAVPAVFDPIRLGSPAALTLLVRALRPGLIAHLSLSPVACAAWVGLFATALNLLPMGQLDGGHILYAVFGRKHKALSRGFFLALLPLGIFCWTGWIVWAVLMLVVGLRHPSLVDSDEPLGRGRKWLAVVAALMLGLCFVPTPFSIR